MNESFLNPFRTKLVNICFIVVSLSFIASISFYFVSEITTQPKAVLSLAGDWTVCVGTECKKTVVPAKEDHPFESSPQYKYLKYSRTFTTPEGCLSGRCGILFSEIADAGEAFINGQRVAVHGGMGKDFVFSKHYPVFEAIDPKIFKKDNLIEVHVETAKIPQSGIRGDLNGFYPYATAKSYVLGRYVYDIFLPIAGAVLLLALCLYTMRKILRATETKPDLQAFAWALSSMALVLISSSNVPREYLPTWVCAYGHFLLKHAVDWSLFYLAYVFYRERFARLRWMNWWVYFSVAVFMSSVFAAQLFLPAFARENHSVIIPFFAMQILFPLRILPYVLMFIGCLTDEREKPWGRYVSGIVILVIAYFQVADIFLSWGLRSGSYYVRFFPVLLGVFYASKIFEIYDEEMAANAVDGENAKGYRRMGMQAAHDLKSPVLSLRHQLRKIELSAKDSRVLSSSLNTISRIAESLEKDFQNQKEVFLSCDLIALCRTVIAEKKIEFKDKLNLKIQFNCEKNVAATSFLDAVELKRVLSNLMNNSMQAITLDMEGEIILSLALEGSRTVIKVCDNGRGIPREKIPQLFARGNTTKRNGMGLGLAHAKETVQAFGGSIKLNSKVGHGTEVAISLPRELVDATEAENVVPLSLGYKRTCVLVEDDKLVADIWREEAEKANVKLVIFDCPKKAATALVKFDKRQTEFYVDVNFGGERLGAEFAKMLHKSGYENVSLSTSYPARAFEDYINLGIAVSGKEPPWS